MVNHDFESYYSDHPAAAFALQVWVNNSWVAARCIAFAVLLGIPIPYILFPERRQRGRDRGLMVSAGKADVLFGLLVPHGLLELTAVFLAGAVGMRLGWSVIAPGDRPRGQVLAEQGRAVCLDGARPGGRPAGVRSGRGDGDAVGAADVGADRDQGRPCGPPSWAASCTSDGGACVPGRPATSTTRPTWCPFADQLSRSSPPRPRWIVDSTRACRSHRQILVGQCRREVQPARRPPPRCRGSAASRPGAYGRCGPVRRPRLHTVAASERPADISSTRGSDTAAMIT